MSDTSPKPGKSLESDLRLIREARGLTREDIFNRVHIRPEVLAQVEEHGFKATPTLNSDIHRRSFVKHYADAVGIDSEFALRALETSVTGLYDGSLAVEYLDLEELNPVPRWAQSGGEEASEEEEPDSASETTEEKGPKRLERVKMTPKAKEPEEPDQSERTEEPEEPEDSEEPEEPEEPEAPEEPEEPEASEDTEAREDSEDSEEPLKLEESEVGRKPDEIAARKSPDETDEGSKAATGQTELPEFDLPTASDRPVFPVPETPPDEDRDVDEPASTAKARPTDQTRSTDEPQSSDQAGLDREAKGDEDRPPVREPEERPSAGRDKPPASKIEQEADPVSPYAPPVPGRQAPPAKPPEVPASERPARPSKPEGEAAGEPEPQAAGESPRRREPATIPSSTLKESVIGPLDEEDYGDEVSFWMKIRGRHWLTWIGLTGVFVVILALVVEAIVMNNSDDDVGRARITSVDQLPDQFSGIVRLTPTTERFVTLQITPDSATSNEFVYKIWTHSAGSTFAETGVGSLNTSNNQVLLGEPYGIGGLFVLENGRFRLRSVRRVRFPKWEFTGHAE